MSLFKRALIFSVFLATYASAAVLTTLAPGVITKCTVTNAVALTFDDGPYNYLKDMVDLLKKNNAKGTFFFNGDNWGCIYNQRDAVKYAYDNGMQVASHTWGHKDLTTLNYDQINSELAQTEQAIQRLTGALVAFTRPPYGNYNDLVRTVAADRGQKLVNWDFDSGDAAGVSVDGQKRLYDDVVAHHPNTILSLQHEVKSTTAYDVLPYAIQKLKAAGYDLVTLAECLGTSPYKSVAQPPSGSWSC